MMESLNGQGYSVRMLSKIFGVSHSGYYDWLKRPPSATELRRKWLAGPITDVHTSSNGTYGIRRVTAELNLDYGIAVNRKTVARIMRDLGISGLPLRKTRRGPGKNAAVAGDLVRRQFYQKAPDHLWMTDITEHPTLEGKLYCCVVLDGYSRKAVGWSIDSFQNAALVTNALAMAIERRSPGKKTIIHADHGTQFTSWAFSQKVKEGGLALSMGEVGCPYDNAVVEAFWARMQVELLNRRKWRTRLELANSIFEYLEIFHNKKRRHSSLGMLSPVAFENQYRQQQDAA